MHRAPLSPWLRSACYYVLYFEVATNVINGLWTLAAPRSALAIMTGEATQSSFDGAAGEAARWFAAVSMAFGGYLLTRVLFLRGRAQLWALYPVLEALIVGDVLYLSSLVPFTLRYASIGIILPYALTLVMFSARATLLAFEDWQLPLAEAEGEPGVRRDSNEEEAPAARLLR